MANKQFKSPHTQAIVNEIEKGIKDFGEYNYYDKGPNEVVETDPIRDTLNSLSDNELADVCCDFIRHGQHTRYFMDWIIEDLDNFDYDTVKNQIVADGVDYSGTYWEATENEPVEIPLKSGSQFVQDLLKATQQTSPSNPAAPKTKKGSKKKKVQAELLDEESVQRALGTLPKFVVHIERQTTVSSFAKVFVMASDEAEAKKRAVKFVESQIDVDTGEASIEVIDDSNGRIEWDTNRYGKPAGTTIDSVEEIGEDHYLAPRFKPRKDEDEEKLDPGMLGKVM